MQRECPRLSRALEDHVLASGRKPLKAGFVEFYRHQDALSAVTAMNKRSVPGPDEHRALTVKVTNGFEDERPHTCLDAVRQTHAAQPQLKVAVLVAASHTLLAD